MSYRVQNESTDAPYPSVTSGATIEPSWASPYEQPDVLPAYAHALPPSQGPALHDPVTWKMPSASQPGSMPDSKSVSNRVPLTRVSQSSGTPSLSQSVAVPVRMSHMSGMSLLLQSPAPSSQSSGMPLPLQSSLVPEEISFASSVPLLLQSTKVLKSKDMVAPAVLML